MDNSTLQSAWGGAETKYFYELTPDRVLSAVEQTGVRCTGRVMALNSMENRVYEVEIELESRLPRFAPERFRIIKFYRPGRWTREQILEEHQFLLDLAEYEIPVPPPIVFEDSGETLRTEPGTNIFFAVFPKVPGKNPEEIADDDIPQLGRLLARLHNVGAIKKAEHRVCLTPDVYGMQNLEYLLSEKVLPPEIEASYETLVRRICEASASMFEGLVMQRIHGDCHLGNLLWGEHGYFWVDFDDMLSGPPVQDVWLLLPGRDDYAQKHLQILLTAYEQMRPFDYSTLRLIEPLRALRIVHFDAWIARRWSDPAFPRTFVEYATPRYWSEQLQQLREQLSFIENNPGHWTCCF